MGIGEAANGASKAEQIARSTRVWAPKMPETIEYIQHVEFDSVGRIRQNRITFTSANSTEAGKVEKAWGSIFNSDVTRKPVNQQKIIDMLKTGSYDDMTITRILRKWKSYGGQ